MIDLVKNLSFIWHVIIASESLLEHAILHSEGDLQQYFIRHLQEERGHAKWLEQDLRSAGVEIRKTQPQQAAVMTVGSIYYLIIHVDPCCLLGYMKFLESQAPNEETLKALEENFPAPLLRTVKYHAKHDPDHLKDIEKMIDSLTLPRKVLVFQTEAITRVHLTTAMASFCKAA